MKIIPCILLFFFSNAYSERLIINYSIIQSNEADFSFEAFDN